MSSKEKPSQAPWYFWVAVAAVATLPVGLILWGKSEAGWASLICALVVMLAARFHAIEELSLGPLRAKLSEKVREVDLALEEVRSLALAMSRPMISMGMKVGRMGVALSRQEAEELRATIDSTLRRLEVPESDIVAAMADYRRYTLFDMSRSLTKKLRVTLNDKVKTYQDALAAFGSPIRDAEGHNRAANEWGQASKRRDTVLMLTEFSNVSRLVEELPDALANSRLLEKPECEALLNELAETLEDMRHFTKHGKIRDMPRWLTASSNDD